MNIENISSALAVIKSTISTIKTAKNLLPKKEDKLKIEKKLEIAEKDLTIAESKIAQELGYQICKCSWPPEIMLSIGHTDYYEKFQCLKCKTIWPQKEPPLSDSWHIS
jgi:hypothetical protein